MQLQNSRNKTTFGMYFNCSAVKLCISRLSDTMRNILITEQFRPVCLYKQDSSLLFSIEQMGENMRFMRQIQTIKVTNFDDRVMIEKKDTQTWKHVTDFYTRYHLRSV